MDKYDIGLTHQLGVDQRADKKVIAQQSITKLDSESQYDLPPLMRGYSIRYSLSE